MKQLNSFQKVEMGNNDLNYHIGQETFKTLNFAAKNEITCYDNCKLVKKDCDVKSAFLSALVSNYAKKFTCPIEFFECTNNVITNKLVSGFYVNQKLRDGTAVDKPDTSRKCSHGGILDTSSYESPRGGINKDSGFLILSPHAHLHEKAALLAIRHTELFFNEIRAKIGDEEFAKFLSLKKEKIGYRDWMNQHIQLCGDSRIKYSLITLIAALLSVLFEFFYEY